VFLGLRIEAFLAKQGMVRISNYVNSQEDTWISNISGFYSDQLRNQIDSPSPISIY
jgi:hypothetical protein